MSGCIAVRPSRFDGYSEELRDDKRPKNRLKSTLAKRYEKEYNLGNKWLVLFRETPVLR